MSVLATDDFNRADGGLGANWTTMGSSPAPQISSNKVVGAGLTNGAIYTGVVCPNDHYAQVQVDQFQGRAVVRCTNISGDVDAYYAEVTTQDNSLLITKYLHGSGLTTLASGTRPSSAPCVVKLLVVGADLSAYVDGVLTLTANDASFATGNFGFELGNVGGDTIDNFEGGDPDEAAGNALSSALILGHKMRWPSR